MGLVCSKNGRKPAQILPTNGQANNGGGLANNNTNAGTDKQPLNDIHNQDSNEDKENASPSPIPRIPSRQNSPLPPRTPSDRSPIDVNDSELDEDQVTAHLTKVAVIGACESGKTTLCQQARFMTKQVPHPMELKHRPAYIYETIFNSLKNLLFLTESLGLQVSSKNEDKVTKIQQASSGHFKLLKSDDKEAIEAVWLEEAVQVAYAKRSQINMNDSIKYFCTNIGRFADMNYVPTTEDLIMLYVPTVGVRFTEVTVSGKGFLLYDFSGRLMERKRWLTLYNTFDAIVFTLAISEFDQKFEDSRGTHSRFLYALQLFEDVCSEEAIKNVTIFLYLNEVDVFLEKLERLCLADYFPAYLGNSEKDALQYVTDMVLDKCKRRPGKVIVQQISAIHTRKTQKVLTDMFKKI